MPFNRHDIYTSSGSVQLFNEWAPYVHKFDTSSFYNWEQDNLPLYDLEDRTYELWEQNGFNTSAGVPGLALTVSADAPAESLAADKNLFTELSACIAAIPKVVRFPVLVEVGSFGDLGNLELHNFRIEEEGSIEIVNRNFTRFYDASSDTQSTQIPNYNKTHTMPYEVSSLDASNTLTDASCVHISALVFNNGADSRAANNCNRVVYPRHRSRKAPLAVGIAQDALLGSTKDEFAVFPYEHTADTAVDDTIYGLDISSTKQSDDSSLVRGVVATETKVGGVMYFNTLNKISVNNCDGPIFIRNFFVDGETVRDDGIKITNSQVVLENCASVRCKKAGFKFNNAGVTLSRSAFSYRNYTLDSATTRAAEVGFGFHAVNSEVTVSSLPLAVTSTSIGDNGASGSDCKVISSRNYAGFVLDNSKLIGGLPLGTDQLGESIVGSELNTGYGIVLNNSFIDLEGLIDVYGNDRGIEADNSKVKFENLCIDAQANEGIISKNSQFIFDSSATPSTGGQTNRLQLDMSANAQHISLAKNSSFEFVRKDSTPTKYGNSRFKEAHGATTWTTGGSTTRYALPAISVNDASILELIHSNIQVSGTADNFGGLPSYGRAIKAVNSSKVSLFGTKNGCTFVIGPAGISFQKKMAGLYGSNNSTINLHGPTAIAQFGVDALVEDSSVLNIEPAKKRNEFGLEVSSFDLQDGGNHTSVELHATRACLVANKNSTINLNDLGAYSVNWGRTASGQTYLNFGADYPIGTFDTSTYTSSGCLQFYPNPQDEDTINDNNLDDLATGLGFGVTNFPTFVGVGGLNRFFVRDEILDAAPNYTDQAKITRGGVAVRATEDSVVNAKNVHFPLGTNDSPLDGFYYTTSGSNCDQFMIWNIADTSRLNASYLSVSGMHPISTQYHGPSAIWASSVDGTNAGNDYNIPAYGAPEGTPDTGRLSVLDVFGAGSGVWTVPSGVDVNRTFDRFYPISGTTLTHDLAYSLGQGGINVSGTTVNVIGAGPHASRNQGPFRIYWTPRSSARILQTDLSGYFNGGFPNGEDFSGVVGPAYQIFAQGYNCSAAVSAIVPTGESNASGDFPDLLRLSYDSDNDGVPDKLWTSGFYYCSEMLDDNPSQCVLDESAARTFANSQHASVGIAGTPRRVTLTRARSDAATNRGSEAYTGDASGSLGFKSAAIFDLSRDN